MKTIDFTRTRKNPTLSYDVSEPLSEERKIELDMLVVSASEGMAALDKLNHIRIHTDNKVELRYIENATKKWIYR